MLIDFIAGNKLDFYSITPVLEAVQKQQSSGRNIGYRLIFTGRQADFHIIHEELSVFNIPSPNLFLEATEDETSEYIATVMVRYEKVLNLNRPDVVMLFGGSNGAMACALAACKATDVKVAHLEAGLRSNNRSSAGETNRVLIDAVTDYYFSISQNSNEHLRNTGVPDDRIYFVGNPVADFLFKEADSIPQPGMWKLLQLQVEKYILLHLSNPAVIQNPARLKPLLQNIIRLSRGLPVILPVHGSAAKAIGATGVKAPNLHLTASMSVADILYLARFAKLVVTDTEALQDETTIMQTPCITLQKSLGRPETIASGFNEATGLQGDAIAAAFDDLWNGTRKKGKTPYMWDGNSSTRILSVLNNSA